jgi:hypothetical protein
MSDIAVQATYNVPQAGAKPPKPAHLIVLTDTVGTGKNKHNRCFLTIEPPLINGNCVQAKGFYTDLSKDEILGSYTELVATVKKESIEELFFSWTYITTIKNLSFKAK